MIKTTKPFLAEDFLLENETALALYNRFAASEPILDFHNHLSPKDIVENRQFANITEVWLEGDHYKWRAMRSNGVAEKYCTGHVPPEEKFNKWAETVPYTLRNPLYHWSHMELKAYFGIDQLLNSNTAGRIYEETTALLRTPDYRVQGLLTRMNVSVVCTTDDPADTLEYHQQQSSLPFRMYPTFRPDKAYSFADTARYSSYLTQLERAAQTDIQSLSDLLTVLQKRIDFFHEWGCRASDHGLEYLPYQPVTTTKAAQVFDHVRTGHDLSAEQGEQLRTFLLLSLCEMYQGKNWVQQFHLGALRNNNSRMMRHLGADTGFDSIGDFPQAKTLAQFLNHLDANDRLGKTILYNLNPADNEVFATMIGNFNDGSLPGKMQYGPAWWFLDQKDGMEKQLDALSSLGLLSRFVGMVTDSRSVMSFPRHEYFRRILCNRLGNEIEAGELPDDEELIGTMIRNICHENAKNYFQFPQP
ncbi:MAG: glucuronate isomerase [Cyclobacteriaceae bacterium]|jgi:glucuronate isomerase|nr:glucuronate isomerase [Cyclobacteriaceae bacterium]